MRDRLMALTGGTRAIRSARSGLDRSSHFLRVSGRDS